MPDAAVDENGGVGGAISSPLDLLGQEDHAKEVLLLSFTLNLEFWERYALSVARGLGARVTVVGDAAMVEASPGHVRYAGITYLDGRAVCRHGGAFHPKLLVIAGEDYATVAIGSGNATLAGWHGNAELWTVLRGDEEGAPTTFTALTAWLRGLSTQVAFSSRVEQSLGNVADLLERLPATAAGPTLLSSLEQPILDQLPLESEADELVVASPFYDRRGLALRRILEGLAPKQTRLFLQPRDLVADGGVLAALLSEANGDAEAISSQRYFHGKLVEWSRGEHRYALTGSPNLSWPALGLTLGDGGNCELALFDEITDTLAPPTAGRFERDDLAAIAFQPRFDAQPALVLLGVLRAPDRVAVRLGRALDAEGALEYLAGAEWSLASVLPAGEEEIELDVLLAAGAAVRVRQDDLVSNVCFVADPTRFTRARVEHVGRVSTDEQQVFLDPGVAENFARDLAELRPFLIQSPAQAGGSAGDGSSGGQVSFTSWEEYLDACEAHLGERLLAYGLALPALGAGEGRREESEGGTLEGETGEEGETGTGGDSPVTQGTEDEPHPSPRFDDLSENQRARYRRWCKQLGELAPQLPYAGRLVCLRLILDAVRGGLFPDPDSWLPLASVATAAVGAAGDGFDEEVVRAASLAAVAVAAMRGQLHRYGEWEEMRFPYETAVDAVTPLLAHAEPDAIERYAAPLEAFFGPSVQVTTVERLVESILQPDPIAEAIRLLQEERGLSADQDGRIIELNDSLPGDPRRTLLSILAYCEAVDVAVRTPDWIKNNRALAAWQAPRLVLVIRNQNGVRGALYELRGFGPGVYKNDVDNLPEPRARWSADTHVPTAAADILDAFDL